MSHNPKHIALLKTQYDPKSTSAEHAAVQTALHEMTETEQQVFYNLVHEAGNHFVALLEDLDAGLETMADAFPEETDPRKWTDEDFLTFELAVLGHQYAELYRTYARQQDNFNLVWKEIEQRLG